MAAPPPTLPPNAALRAIQDALVARTLARQELLRALAALDEAESRLRSITSGPQATSAPRAS